MGEWPVAKAAQSSWYGAGKGGKEGEGRIIMGKFGFGCLWGDLKCPHLRDLWLGKGLIEHQHPEHHQNPSLHPSAGEKPLKYECFPSHKDLPASVMPC